MSSLDTGEQKRESARKGQRGVEVEEQGIRYTEDRAWRQGKRTKEKSPEAPFDKNSADVIWPEQKMPVVGDYFVREIPPSDNVSPPVLAC